MNICDAKWAHHENIIYSGSNNTKLVSKVLELIPVGVSTPLFLTEKN